MADRIARGHEFVGFPAHPPPYVDMPVRPPREPIAAGDDLPAADLGICTAPPARPTDRRASKFSVRGRGDAFSSLRMTPTARSSARTGEVVALPVLEPTVMPSMRRALEPRPPWFRRARHNLRTEGVQSAMCILQRGVTPEFPRMTAVCLGRNCGMGAEVRHSTVVRRSNAKNLRVAGAIVIVWCLAGWASSSHAQPTAAAPSAANNAAGRLCTAKPPREVPHGRRKKTAWPTIGANGEIISAYEKISSGVTNGLAGPIPSLWDTGQTIRVRITGFSVADAATIQSHAQSWTNHVNLNLVFVGANDRATIRVVPGSRNYSVVGRDNLSVPPNEPTMLLNLAGLTPDEVRRKALHEFGHALGWIHEHQSPAAGINWDKPKVYAFFKGPPNNWSEADVDRNIFRLYSANSTNYSPYDPDSIMHYDVDPSLTTDGIGVTAQNVLSATDMKYARRWYPFMGDASGQLRTGDDCDVVEFRVDYSSTDAGRGYRFSLDQGRDVTWWKGIRVPLKEGKWYEFGVEDQHSATTTFDPDELDLSRPIGFGKAKGLGGHTWLSYTWPVMSVLPKKTRIQFTWTNDHCP